MPPHRLLVRLHHALPIDFCVWILQRDGLQVAPYLRHAATVGPLQRVGLSAARWRDWFDAVIAHQHQFDTALQQAAQPLDAALFDQLNPSGILAGQGDLPAMLDALWHTYIQQGDMHQQAKRQRAAGYQPALRNILQQLHDLHPPSGTSITLYAVTYPADTLHLHPPTSLVVSLQDDTVGSTVAHAQLLHSITDLIRHQRSSA